MNKGYRVILPWKESRYLVISSLSFLVPCIYSYVHHLYFYSFVLLATSLVSANYWRDAASSYRRDMDMVVSKVATAIFVCSGLYYYYRSYETALLPDSTVASSVVVTCIMMYAYYRSLVSHTKGDNRWYRYHLLFHVCLLYMQCLIVRQIHIYQMFL